MRVVLISMLLQLLWLPQLEAQLPVFSSRSLDALLQDYAFRAFVRPRTGIPYDANVPSNLTGIQVSAMRLRSGSFRRRGVPVYKEFGIPIGVLEQPFVERLVLVYHNLANWSALYYPLPGYSYLAPVLGLLAYNASNLPATNLPELDIRASLNPISIKFPDVKLAPDGPSPMCVYFDLHGLVEFNTVMNENVCSTTQQGHFSIVVESAAPSPAPAGEGPPPSSGGRKNKYKVWIIVGSVIGVSVLLVVLGLLFVWVERCKLRKKMQQMEKAAEVGEDLRMTSIGNNRKAPMAMGRRTQPVLENEYAP